MSGNLSNKTCLVTGATAGIGKEIARKLYERGARVGLVSRSKQKGESVMEELRVNNSGGSLELFTGDLSSGADIKSITELARKRFDSLDILINNAGVYSKKRIETEDGFELQYAVNYLAQFRMVRHLFPLLKKSAPSRIVNVGSMEHYLGKLYTKDLQLTKNYLGTRAYRQSKLCVILFTRELAKRLQGTGITVNAVHPGVVYTDLVLSISGLAVVVKYLLKTPAQGAEGPVYLATDDATKDISGEYFHTRKKKKPSKPARDDSMARWLWEETEKMLGIEPWPEKLSEEK